MRIRAPFLILIAAVLAAPPAFAGADGPWLPLRGEYYSEMTASRSFADTYFGYAGGRGPLPFGQRFESRAVTFRNELGWKKWGSLVIEAPLRSTTSSIPDYDYARTETGFGDLDFGVRFKLRSGGIPVAMQVDWLAPLGYQTNYTPTLGRTRQALRDQLLAGWSSAAFNVFAQGGVNYVWAQDTRNSAGGTALAGVWLGKSWLALGHYNVVTVLEGDDTATDDIGVQSVGPELRYRVDDRIDVFLGSNHDASGRSVLHQDSYYFGMAFRQSRLNRLQGLLGNTSRP